MSPLRDLLPDECIVEKICFSAVPEEVLFQAPGGDRAQFIVAGTEAHVCVQQTVLDLLAAGRRVFVVEEAVGSRRSGDKALALERMRGHGADIVSREMVVFEWLRQAGSDLFREISRDFIRESRCNGSRRDEPVQEASGLTSAPLIPKTCWRMRNNSSRAAAAFSNSRFRAYSSISFSSRRSSRASCFSLIAS
jgi:hypothetical protein